MLTSTCITKLIKSIFIGIVTLSFFLSLFYKELSISKHKHLHNFTLAFVHGVVVNQTTQPIRISEFRSIKLIPPGKKSTDVGISDADSLLIDYPTLIERKKYKDGLIKFCDFGVLTVKQEKNLHRVYLSKGITLCKFFHDFGYYKKISDVFRDDD